jgi:hypothetical protein
LFASSGLEKVPIKETRTRINGKSANPAFEKPPLLGGMGPSMAGVRRSEHPHKEDFETYYVEHFLVPALRPARGDGQPRSPPAEESEVVDRR